MGPYKRKYERGKEKERRRRWLLKENSWPIKPVYIEFFLPNCIAGLSLSPLSLGKLSFLLEANFLLRFY
jgi:hypothetical protein